MAKIMGLILVPFYTNEVYLSKSEYGVMGLVESIIAIAPTILILGINWGFSRFYWDADYKGRQKELLFNNLFVVLIAASISLSVVLFFREPLSVFLFTSIDYTRLLVMITVISFFITTNGVITELLKLRGEALKLTGVNLVYFTVLISLVLYKVVYQKMGLYGVYEAQLYTLILQSIIYLPILFKNVKVKIDMSIIRDLVVYSLPMAISSLSSIIFSLADKYTLRFMSDLPEVGYYSLGFRLSNTFKIIISASVLSALVPILYKKMKTEEGYELHNRSFRYLSIIGACLAIAFILLRKEIVGLFVSNDAYLVAAVVVPFIVTGIYIALLKDIVVVGLKIEKKTLFIGTITVLLSLVNVVLNILFVKIFIYFNMTAILGTALATLVSQAIYLFVVYKFSRKCYPVRYRLKTLFTCLLILVAFIFMGEIGNNMSAFLAFIYRSVLVCAFPFALYLLGILGKTDVDNILSMFKDFKNRVKK
jgi:O-antigen/teichoic acid export membrane protein